MDVRRARNVSATVVVLSLLLPSVIAHVASAATCTLTAPATVKVGTPLVITGSGFPATTSVDVALTLDAGAPDELTVQSDAAGAFQINLTPEPADVGTTTVVATAGATCSARVVFTVTAPSPTATPKSTATPKASATSKPTTAPKPTATLEPDGSAAGAVSGEETAPRTDADQPLERASGRAPLTAWVLAVLLLVMGIGGVIAARRPRSR